MILSLRTTGRGTAPGAAHLLLGGAMGENQRAFERALHESTAIADRIREAIADAPPKLVMLALSDLLQEHLTHSVMVESEREQTLLSKTLFSN
jgi:hypothetical protein